MALRLSITDLNNLPENFTITGPTSPSTRSGNVFSVNGGTGFAWDFSYYRAGTDPAFVAGDVVEISLSIDTWGQSNRYLRAYMRGKASGGSDVSGKMIWSLISGMQPDITGQDANSSVRTNSLGTFILRVVFTADSWGFRIYFAPVWNDWSNASGSWTNAKVTFNYLYANQPKDPYSGLPGMEPSGPGGGGGGGTGVVVQDDIDFPPTPGIGAVDTGFISIWTPNEQQIRSLASYLWNADLLTIDFWKKLMNSPLELIYGLSIVPINLEPGSSALNVQHTSLTLGEMNTGIDMNYVDQQYVEVDMGYLELAEFWGAFIDYDPYTKLSIYLPYIGIRDLSTDDCMPETVHVKYKIDLASGSCVALVKCGPSVLYHFAGNVASQVPVTASQQQELVRSAISVGISAGTAIGAIASGVGAAAAAPAIMSTLSGSLGMKSQYARSGSLEGAAGLLDVQAPYLIITRPRQALPEEQNKYTGYPSFITETLGEIEGYTEVEAMHLEGIECTEAELGEIEQLLRSGVIL